jgi:1-acyl-sn-glycerol-3-phosphate acyltransferase
MRPWNRGFVRVAAALDLPIVPAAVLGGEECLPVAWTVKLLEPLVGARFGLPLALLPLPARWRVVFHAPVRLGEDRQHVLANGERSRELAAEIQATVQRSLDRLAVRSPLAHLSSWLAMHRPSLGRSAGDAS